MVRWSESSSIKLGFRYRRSLVTQTGGRDTAGLGDDALELVDLGLGAAEGSELSVC